VAGPDAVAVPQPPRGLVDRLRGGALQGVLVPVAVLGEGLQGLPVLGEAEADQGLGDGVLLDVEDQAGHPLLEAQEAGVGEGTGAGGQQRLPVVPQVASLPGAPPVFEVVSETSAAAILPTGGAVGHPQIPTPEVAKKAFFPRNYWLKTCPK